MASPTAITSAEHLAEMTRQHTTVVVDFWATWCGPCKTISPIFGQLAAQLARPNRIAFVKVDVDALPGVAQSWSVTAMPTFVVIKHGRERQRVTGADGKKLQDMVRKIAAEAESVDADAGDAGASSSTGNTWHGAAVARAYADVTSTVDTRGLELLNADGEFGGVRVLFDGARPSGLPPLAGGKAPASASTSAGSKKDYVVSDTDEQLMLLVPFASECKLHSLHITSLPSSGSAEATLRPRTIHLYLNQTSNLGFDEASAIPPTQSVSFTAKDWDAATHTAVVPLRFVKFQRCYSLVVFVVDGEQVGEGDDDEIPEKTRIDRIRFIGESGEKREMGKLEKIGDEAGE